MGYQTITRHIPKGEWEGKNWISGEGKVRSSQGVVQRAGDYGKGGLEAVDMLRRIRGRVGLGYLSACLASGML
eukprot:1129726-Amorphochlora_amoeboformis.AAC.2